MEGDVDAILVQQGERQNPKPMPLDYLAAELSAYKLRNNMILEKKDGGSPKLIERRPQGALFRRK